MRGRLRRMRAVARIEALHVAHDRSSLALVLSVPALQLLLFGYAVNLDPRGIPLAIARANASEGDRIRRAIDASNYFRVVADGLAPGAAAERVRAGEALLGIELPELDYSDPEASSDPPRIVADGSDPAVLRPALAALEREWTRARAEASGIGPGQVEVEWLHNPQLRTTWTIVPPLAGVVVMISMLMLGALTLARERERGTWEALLATPVDGLDALFGKLAPYVAVGALQAAAILAIGRWLFELPFAGSVAALLAAVPLYALAHLCLGFAFSALAASQLQAVQGAVFFYLPSMLLSGFLFPFHGMPGWARALGELLPLTHFVRAARGVLLRGDGPTAVAAQMLPVLAFALVAIGVSLLAYRRRVD